MNERFTNHEEMYEELLRRGFHEDFLDDATIGVLTRLYDSGARGDEEMIETEGLGLTRAEIWQADGHMTDEIS